MKICIFCASSPSKDPQVLEEITTLTSYFSDHQIELVYGGAGIGIMGALANELIVKGGVVTGVIPQQLMKKEIAHAGLNELFVVKDMHERKKKMYDLSDAFLILPGGMGTLDEFFEILTWKQLGIHHKPIAILNINHYYDHLLAFLGHAVQEGLIRPSDQELFYASSKWEEIMIYFKKEIA